MDFDDLTLHYQPQVSADGLRVVAAEALVRMAWPTPRDLTAAEILVHFADAEAAERLDMWAFDRACRDALRWPSIVVSVNLTAQRFLDRDLPGKLRAIAADVGIDPGRIEIEIVESAYIGDFEIASRVLAGLRAAGFRIAIDDFGTGYSSLSYLLKLPVDKLKIDKCFVDDIETMAAAAIVQAIAALARALGLKVTAEGVETVEQWRILRAAGCHFMQGWLFSKAVAPHELAGLLMSAGPRLASFRPQ